MSSLRQASAFGIIGLCAAAAHYGTLIALVEGARWSPVPATLCGYVAGGVISYIANRRVTFATTRRHRDAIWRFIVVAAVGFCITFILMIALVDWEKVPYLLAQIVTTGCVMLWSFLAHKLWTFSGFAPP